MQHPNLVTLEELIEDDGRWFLTMELVEGTDFLGHVTRGAGAVGSEAAFQPTDRMPTALAPSGGGPSSPLPVGSPLSQPAIVAAALSAPAWEVAIQPPYDEAKLRAALGQLARGLTALHLAGKLHRDIKPTNILVTRAGRVVLLDFGLVANLEEHAAGGIRSSSHQVVGTSAYMAPEQAASKPLGAPADWYAVGVILYEALTGRLPFNGSAIEILMNKQRFEPAPPRALVPAVPPDLDALCVELLRFEPRARPNARDVLRRLNVEDAFEPSGGGHISSSSSHGQLAPFVGREEELSVLARAFADTRGQGTERAPQGVTVLVEGASGVGKTALVRQFTRALLPENPSAVVLSGRCYERESVPYKAFDGVVDSLSQYLLGIGARKASAILPLKAALLAQAFPVLRQIEPIAAAPMPQHDGLDPQELRTRVFATMRELFLRLGDREPVIVVIDDLQWADADSLALLRELTRPPDPPVLLLIGTLRDGTAATTARSLLGELRHLRVSELPPRHARALAAELIGRIAPLSPINADSIVGESGGPSPLHRRAGPARLALRRGRPRARSASTTRSGPASTASRRTCNGSSTSRRSPVRRSRPPSLPAPRGSTRSSSRSGSPSCAWLTSSGRARRAAQTRLNRSTTGSGPHVSRTSTSARSEPPTAASPSRSKRPSAPSPSLSSCTGAAPAIRPRRRSMPPSRRRARRKRSRSTAPRSSTRARSSSCPRTRASGVGLEEKRGDALANGGRGGEAAAAYIRAIPGSNAAAALDLQRRAAEQLLRIGQVDDGLETLRTVLAAVDMELPKTPQRALTTLLWRRSRIWMRGLGFIERDASQLSPAELTRIDICWSAANGLAMVDVIRGAGFQAQHLLIALDAGEPYRVARAIAMEGAYVATEGAPAARRATELFDLAASIAARAANPHATALITLTRGNAHYFTGAWKLAQQRCDEAEALFRDECTGVSWEIHTAQTFSLWSLLWLGEVREFWTRTATFIAEAEERGDLYALTAFRTARAQYGYPAHDDVGTGRNEVAGVMERWSRRGFQLPHWWELFAMGNLDLYEGGPAAHRRIEARLDALAGSMLLRIQVLRLEVTHFRARAALAAAQAIPEDRATLNRLARNLAAKMAREHVPWSDALATAIRAAAAHIDGRPEESLRLLDEAARGFDATDMALMAAMSRRRKGVLLGGDEGRALVAAADALMARERIVRPERMTAMLMPGFPD